jgi:DNA-binding NarL/FixJ family response regulator
MTFVPMQANEKQAKAERNMTPSRRITLTPREEAIVRLVLAAKTNKAIAGELGISEQSVKNRLTTLYRKFGVSSRLQLMRSLLRPQ